MGDAMFVKAYRSIRNALDEECDDSETIRRAARAVASAGFQPSSLYPSAGAFVEKFLPHITKLVAAENAMG
jgi:hypothetical protein